MKLKMYYKRYCSILRKTIRRAKKLYYNELIAKSENKNKMTWQIVKNLTRKTQNSQQVFPTFKVDGVEQSPEQAVEAFNNYFLNITENLNIHTAQDDNPI
jgi:DNA polymerase IIIc chi subunit